MGFVSLSLSLSIYSSLSSTKGVSPHFQHWRESQEGLPSNGKAARAGRGTSPVGLRSGSGSACKLEVRGDARLPTEAEPSWRS